MDGGVSARTSSLGRDKSVQRPEDGPLMFPEPHTDTVFFLMAMWEFIRPVQVLKRKDGQRALSMVNEEVRV